MYSRRRPSLECRSLLTASLRAAQELPVGADPLEAVVEPELVGEAHAAVSLGRHARHFAADLRDVRLRVAGGQPCLVRQSILRVGGVDRKSTRLNSSHEWISYAVFCLKKKK